MNQILSDLKINNLTEKTNKNKGIKKTKAEITEEKINNAEDERNKT